MKILLSNDDGIKARGIKILHGLLTELGHEVRIVAAEQQSSGSSHSITITAPLVPRKIWENGVLYGIAINGFPTDSVTLGLCNIYPDTELVASGINLGHNAGPAVHYSGTVAAAAEGAMAGKPALAFSFDSFHEPDFDGLEDKFRPFLPICFRLCAEPGLYNINIPNVPKIKGIKITRHFQGFYRDRYDPRQDPRGRDYYWLANEGYSQEAKAFEQDQYPNDLQTITDGYIAITPLQFDCTNRKALVALTQKLANSQESSAKTVQELPAKTVTKRGTAKKNKK